MPIQSKIVSMYHGNTLWCSTTYEHCSKLMRTSVYTHTFDMHILGSFLNSASHILGTGSSYYYSIIEIVVIGLYSEFGVVTFTALSSFRCSLLMIYFDIKSHSSRSRYYTFSRRSKSITHVMSSPEPVQ